MISKRWIVQGFLVWLALDSVSVCVTQAAPPANIARPNVVLILIDDLGWADVGCNGADLHETPHIDELARQGLRFTHAYAAAPVCTPTRAALLTGKHPARLQMTTWRENAAREISDQRLVQPKVREDLPHEERTLAEIFKQNGYLTAHIGKWHLGDLDYFPETQGFDVHIGGNHWGAPASHFFPYRGDGVKSFRYVPHMEWGREGEYLTDRLTDETIRVMERAKDRPFFLNVWHYAVRSPIQAKPADVEHFRGKIGPNMNHRNAAYAAMVRSMDQSVGRILAKLDELGLSQRTMVVFTSDNGGYLGDEERMITSNAPLRSGKGSLYEGGIRVPLLIRWPGVTAPGSVSSESVVSQDVFETLREACGGNEQIKIPPTDGVSLRSHLSQPRSKVSRDALFWHYPHYYRTTTPVSAARVGPWKLLHYFEDDRLELYNLDADPTESRDLAATHVDKVRELRSRLEGWRASVNAPMPAKNRNHR